MKYLSVFSGIEAASVAWKSLGWEAIGFSEIEPFPCAVLKHRFPNTPNYGDITKYNDWPIEPGTVNLLIGGSPCQSFSVAGLRKGLADPRGNLALVFLGLADKIRPRWIVWENVPGVLSSNGGRDFGSFVGALEQLGYGWAMRVLDAQYFGVPQRRRRVFVVASLGGRDVAASVLFKPESLCWDPSTRRKKGKKTSSKSGTSIEANGQPFTPTSFGQYAEGVGTIRASGGDLGGGSETLLAQAICATGEVTHCLTKSYNSSEDGTGRGLPITVYDKQEPNSEVSGTIRANPGSGWRSDGTPVEPVVISKMSVRKLTPVETERLQGFPDNWSKIPWKGKPADQCPDGPRYKACGNSMAVPVMRWIGEQIALVEAQAK
jgi:DNA (cytosine-5)-methyltransferase 1